MQSNNFIGLGPPRTSAPTDVVKFSAPNYYFEIKSENFC